MIYKDIHAYKRYQLQECKAHTDLDMVLGHLETIPHRIGIDTVECEMFDQIRDAVIDILAQHDWLEGLYDIIAEEKRRDALENEDAHVDACELEMNVMREDAAMGRMA